MTERNEPWRPQVHYTPAAHWISDPNGLVWMDGEYHLFYQHNPFANAWGHMSWGHAVSADLLHWRELPVAIEEDEYVSIFSGSAVVDADNTSGFGVPAPVGSGSGSGSGSSPAAAAPMVAIYTGCLRRPEGGQAQELAYSRDRGRSFTPFAGNPVLDLQRRDFRDPKVFWHAPSAQWVMAVVLPDEHQVLLYGSPNLRQWHELSRFGPAGEAQGIWECPDLFEIPIEDAAGALTGHRRWLLKVDSFSGHPGGTGAQYFVGHFDGIRFVEDAPGGPPQWADCGADFYAALSFNHLPNPHQRPVWIGWLGNHGYAAQTPTTPWRGAMSVPRELALRAAVPAPPDGLGEAAHIERDAPVLRLVQRPLPALAGLRGEVAITVAEQRLSDERRELSLLNALHPALQPAPQPGLHPRPHPGPRPAPRFQALDIEFSIAALSSHTQAGIDVCVGPGQATRIGYDAARQAVFIDRTHSGFTPDHAQFPGRRHAPATPPSKLRPLHLRVIVDASSVEVFADDGAAVLSEQIFPAPGSQGLAVFAASGQAMLGALRVWPLASTVDGRAA